MKQCSLFNFAPLWFLSYPNGNWSGWWRDLDFLSGIVGTCWFTQCSRVMHREYSHFIPTRTHQCTPLPPELHPLQYPHSRHTESLPWDEHPPPSLTNEQLGDDEGRWLDWCKGGKQNPDTKHKKSSIKLLPPPWYTLISHTCWTSASLFSSRCFPTLGGIEQFRRFSHQSRVLWGSGRRG